LTAGFLGQRFDIFQKKPGKTPGEKPDGNQREKPNEKANKKTAKGLRTMFHGQKPQWAVALATILLTL
jgi:hypothetical protein